MLRTYKPLKRTGFKRVPPPLREDGREGIASTRVRTPVVQKAKPCRKAGLPKPMKKQAKDYALKKNGKPRKRPGKATGASLTRYASRLARKACMAECGHVCKAAGKYGVECAARPPTAKRRWPFLEWCHIKARGMGGNSRLKFHPENCVALCGAHHQYFTNHPLTFGEFIEELWPGRLSKLAELERTLPKGSNAKFWAAYYTELGFTATQDESAYLEAC